jgi:predicted subunit of tRNA(5-methylaminomethyl-2-thiouridylate) methyltransferase
VLEAPRELVEEKAAFGLPGAHAKSSRTHVGRMADELAVRGAWSQIEVDGVRRLDAVAPLGVRTVTSEHRENVAFERRS